MGIHSLALFLQKHKQKYFKFLSNERVDTGVNRNVRSDQLWQLMTLRGQVWVLEHRDIMRFGGGLFILNQLNCF